MLPVGRLLPIRPIVAVSFCLDRTLWKNRACCEAKKEVIMAMTVLMVVHK